MLAAMAKDPLHIIGLPRATDEERGRVTAFAGVERLPPKLCRYALHEAGGDEQAARRLLADR